MTPVGKILVFVNLIFSLFVGAMGLMVFTADTNKNAEIVKVQREREVLKASNTTYQEENKTLQESGSSSVKEKEVEIAKLKAEVEDFKRVKDDLDKKYNEASKKLYEKDIVLQTAVAESSRRQEQNAQMSEILKAEVKRNSEISTLLEQTRAKEIAERISAQTFKSTNERLEVQLREMAKDMERAKAGGTSALTQVNKATKNPPPDNIEGMVKVADVSGLIKISIGSDAGLTKGHTLEVFRLSAVATQSKYLGTVRILEVTPNEAVAQPVKPLSDKPIAGDRVASRILGS
ncbi:MAG: hypothetical protein ACOYNM_08065 [Gemmataceae bacterium]